MTLSRSWQNCTATSDDAVSQRPADIKPPCTAGTRFGLGAEPKEKLPLCRLAIPGEQRSRRDEALTALLLALLSEVIQGAEPTLGFYWRDRVR